MSTADLWTTLRRTWWWLVIGALAGILVAGLALLVLPKTYESDTSVLINAGSADPAVGDQDLLDFTDKRMPNYVQMAESDAAVTAIGSREGASAEDVRSRLTFAVPQDTTVITIAATGDSAAAAQRTARSAADVVSKQISGTSTPATAVTASVLDAARPGHVVSPQWTVLLASGLVAGLVVAFLAALAAGSRRVGRDQRDRAHDTRTVQTAHPDDAVHAHSERTERIEHVRGDERAPAEPTESSAWGEYGEPESTRVTDPVNDAERPRTQH